jgi:hypothetical protein
VDLAAIVLVLVGTLQLSLAVIFAGILVATGGVTSHVSSGRHTPHRTSHDGRHRPE